MNGSSHFGHVFISYTHHDAVFVDSLARDLKMRGLTVWFDRRGIRPGTSDWEREIRSALGNAYAVVYVASPAAINSRYVRDELNIARDYQHPVYPLLIAGHSPRESLPLGWGSVQFIDARSNYPGALEELVMALKSPPPRTAVIPVPPAGGYTGPPIGYVAPRYRPMTPSMQPSRPGKAGVLAGCGGAGLAIGVIGLVLVGFLFIFVIKPLADNFSKSTYSSSGANTPPPQSTFLPPSPEAARLTITPQNFQLTHTLGSSNGCFYSTGSGWSCEVTLKNISNSSSLTWTTNASPSTITISPSSFSLPPQQDMNAEIRVPETSCGPGNVTFTGPGNSIVVSLTCT